MFNYDRKLIDYVPVYYDELLESSEILSAENVEVARLNASINDLLAQFNVATSTWGLREWERIVGVTTDVSKPLGERRSVVIAKLRGAGVVTIEHVENVAEAFQGGDIEVIERYADYTIVLKFVSDYGVPSNIDDLTAILREIIPAHLAIEYEFKFVTYDIVKGYYDTYDSLLATGFAYSEILSDGE